MNSTVRPRFKVVFAKKKIFASPMNSAQDSQCVKRKRMLAVFSSIQRLTNTT